jgi:hypothetical protein
MSHPEDPRFHQRVEGSRAHRDCYRVFRHQRAILLNLQDAFAIHQVKKKYSRELRAIKLLAAASR